MLGKRGINKKAQHTMGLPFGVIFAIFLIIVFIVIAFIAVNHFLEIGDCSKVGKFYDDLQDKIGEAISGQESNFLFDVDLPSGIDVICFANLSDDIHGEESDENYQKLRDFEIYDGNIFLLPRGKACDMSWKKMDNINITKITKEKNPYCIDLERRNELRIKKGFYDKYVVIE